MKKTTLILIIFLLSIAAVLAQESHDSEITEGKKLVENKISCDELNSEQLEAIGEYYMEQMHPGEAHEMMDKMMGGEGSESLKQVHINMAKRLYCNDNIYIGYEMMGSGGMMNMVAGGMMGGQNVQNVQGNMMGNWGYGFSYGNVMSILYIILLIGLIILVYLWIIKLWKKGKNKGGKK